MMQHVERLWNASDMTMMVICDMIVKNMWSYIVLACFSIDLCYTLLFWGKNCSTVRFKDIQSKTLEVNWMLGLEKSQERIAHGWFFNHPWEQIIENKWEIMGTYDENWSQMGNQMVEHFMNGTRDSPNPWVFKTTFLDRILGANSCGFTHPLRPSKSHNKINSLKSQHV